jgi:hypothetical protein
MAWVMGCIVVFIGGWLLGVSNMLDFYKKRAQEGKLCEFGQEIYKFTKVEVKDEAN